MFRLGGGQTLIINGNLILQGRRAGVGVHTGDNNSSVIWVQNGATLELRNGTIRGNTHTTVNVGGGVHVAGSFSNTTFLMSGGEISGNNGQGSGGVYINSSTFTLTGGEISGNTAPSGGGVFINNTTFTMTGGKIINNTATSGHSGGVNVLLSTFIMEGGEINGNRATTTGGGVHISRTSNFSKTGNSIITGFINDPNGNVVRNASNVVVTNGGHAVNVASTPNSHRREGTVGAGDDIGWDGAATGTWD
jgi:hypothetical protein